MIFNTWSKLPGTDVQMQINGSFRFCIQFLYNNLIFYVASFPQLFSFLQSRFDETLVTYSNIKYGNCDKNEPPSWVHAIDFLSPNTNVGYGSGMRKKNGGFTRW